MFSMDPKPKTLPHRSDGASVPARMSSQQRRALTGGAVQPGGSPGKVVEVAGGDVEAHGAATHSSVVRLQR